MPRDQLMRGDMILQVNGAQSPGAMRQALIAPGSLELLVLRPPSAFKAGQKLSEQLREAPNEEVYSV